MKEYEEFLESTGMPQELINIKLGRTYGYNSNASGSSHTYDIESQNKKLEEMEANIPKRALMLKKLFDEDISLSHLPKLPLELWNIVAEYEGGVESSVLGDNNTNTSSWSWCNML